LSVEWDHIVIKHDETGVRTEICAPGSAVALSPICHSLTANTCG